MVGIYLKPINKKGKIKFNFEDLRKKDRYFHCKILNNKIEVMEKDPLIVRSKMDEEKLWEQILNIYKHIHNSFFNLSYFGNEGGNVRKENLLPLVIKRGKISVRNTDTGKILNDSEIKEDYPDEYKPKDKSVYYIDEYFIVWKVNEKGEVEEDEDYKKRQMDWIIDKCKREIENEKSKLPENKIKNIEEEIEHYQNSNYKNKDKKLEELRKIKDNLKEEIKDDNLSYEENKKSVELYNKRIKELKNQNEL